MVFNSSILLRDLCPCGSVMMRIIWRLGVRNWNWLQLEPKVRLYLRGQLYTWAPCAPIYLDGTSMQTSVHGTHQKPPGCYMFLNAKNFSFDIGAWNTSKVSYVFLVRFIRIDLMFDYAGVSRC